MADLRTTFVGLELDCPIVVGSAGITETVERMQRCQDNGAAAVVMKSWFQEEISRHSPTPRFDVLRHDMGRDKTFTLFSYEQASEWDLKRFAQEVADAKAKLAIKVFPSINCTTDEGWVTAAQEVEADLLCMSALMTTTIIAIKDYLPEFKAKLPNTKIMIGGAPLNQHLADEWGADGYGENAIEAARVALRLVEA